MIMNRISRDEAEDIIVNGLGSGFSQIVIMGNLFTIYHRLYCNEYFNIAEVTYNFISDDEEDMEVVVFYDIDNGEVTELLGFNPRDALIDDLIEDGLI